MGTGAEAATRRLVRELAERDDVEAVLMFGSRARGDARPDSDVDLAVIVKEGRRRAFEERDGQAFELVYVSEAGASHHFRSDLDAAADFWSSARVLHDRTGAAERLQQEIGQLLAKGKPRPPAEEIAVRRFNAEDQLRAAAGFFRHDPATAEAVLNKEVLDATAAYFDLRGLWIPPLKRRLGALAEHDAGLHGLVSAFYANHADFQARLALAREVAGRVYAG